MQTAGQCHADSGTAQCRHNRASPVRSPMPPPQPVQTVPARTVSSYRASSSIPSWRPRLPTSLRAGLARQARRCKCMSLPTTLAPPRSTRTQEQSASARPHPRARLALLRRQVHLHRDDRPQLGRRAAVLRPGLVQLEAVQRARVPRDARRQAAADRHSLAAQLLRAPRGRRRQVAVRLRQQAADGRDIRLRNGGLSRTLCLGTQLGRPVVRLVCRDRTTPNPQSHFADVPESRLLHFCPLRGTLAMRACATAWCKQPGSCAAHACNLTTA